MKELSSIRKQIADLQEKEKQLIQEDKQQAIERIKTIMAESNISISDLATKKTKAASKVGVVLFRDGENTWSGGRGRKPLWVNEYIAKGVDIEKFRI
jgi:DNA-binding protein H-NS